MNAGDRPDQPLWPVEAEAENYLRGLDDIGMRSVTIRYFNVAGAAIDGHRRERTGLNRT